MKKRYLSVFVCVFLVASCERPATVLDQAGLDFSILDGSDIATVTCGQEDPCWHFFFLPPITPTPAEFHGSFNPNLRPEVVISELYDVLSPECVTGPIVRTFKGDVSVSVDNENYSVGWQTGGDNLVAGQTYRICVRLNTTTLGYRDIQPDENGADVPRNPEQNPVFQFNNGSNLPIKFRIETGLFCKEGVDCGEATVDTEGATVLTTSYQAALALDSGALQQEYTVIIEEVPCPRTSDGRVRYLDIDIPQFPGCYDMRTDPELTGGFTPGAGVIAGVCYDASSIPASMLDYLQLHHERAPDTVEALVNVPGPVGLDCSNFTAMASSGGGLMQLASWGWNSVKKVLGVAVMPKEAVAAHRGFGGGDLTGLSPLVWAVPSQFEKVADGFIGPEGSIVYPEVLVTTEQQEYWVGSGENAVYQVKPSRPIPGATVRFAVTIGNGPPILDSALTDANGIASLPWTLGPLGPNELEAFGTGIGVAVPDGGSYRDSRVPTHMWGTFGDHHEGTVDLGTGVLTFHATACPVGPTVDGAMDAGEWAGAQSMSFNANLSGGSTTPATFYWYNDCDNLYLAVSVERDAADKVNTVRIDVDNDGDGLPALGDDVWFLDGDAGMFEDRFLSSNCVNKKQSDCGYNDTEDGGSYDGFGAQQFDAVNGLSVYEISHPLVSGDLAHDMQVSFGDQIGVFVTLSLGKGAQGNTQWPEFRVYLPITILQPGSASP
ncbi:MAG: hypothetical protein OEY63_02275 [Gemmatimonadota bacterium]|nr:hypothetical protein [Gemmatimonadota bacterium]MDH5803824.1 hypothetical protein [Gemmatimonadota bacterium]